MSASTITSLSTATPKKGAILELTVDRIKPCDRNPRKTKNPEYERLQHAILTKKELTALFDVTLRPGETLYMPCAGGNTRLKIMMDAWKTTRDPDFYKVQCRFRPYVSEAELISAHLMENELRGSMLMIDIAFGLRELRNELRAQSGQTLTESQFKQHLNAMGYRVSRRQLSRYGYAVDVLDALIPEALRAGLGVRKLDEIRNTHTAYRTLCGENQIARFESTFAHVMTENDGDCFSIELMRCDLDARIADLLGRKINHVRLEVDAALSNSQVSDRELESELDDINPKATEFSPELEPLPDDSGLPAVTDIAVPPDTGFQAKQTIPQSVQQIQSTLPTKPESGVCSDHGDLEETHQALPRLDGKSGDDNGHQREDLDPFYRQFTNRGANSGPDELKTLRSRAYVLAAKLAKAYGIEPCVSSARIGYGFIVEIPDAPMTDERLFLGWWTLVGLSEQTITEGRLQLLAEAGLKLPHLYAQRKAREITCAEDDPVQNHLGSPPTIESYPYRFLLSTPVFDNAAFKTLLQLIECCAFTRSLVPETFLWDCSTVEQESLNQLAAGPLDFADDGVDND